MESKQDVDALGKNRDKAAEDKDFAKKQSDKQPAAENLDMNPNSVNQDGKKGFDPNPSVKKEAENYAEEEHKKAQEWEDHSSKKADK